MKKILISITLLVVAGLSIFYLARPLEQPSAPDVQTRPLSVSKDDIPSDWVSSDYGNGAYTFSYPNNWKVIEEYGSVKFWTMENGRSKDYIILFQQDAIYDCFGPDCKPEHARPYISTTTLSDGTVRYAAHVEKADGTPYIFSMIEYHQEYLDEFELIVASLTFNK